MWRPPPNLISVMGGTVWKTAIRGMRKEFRARDGASFSLSDGA